MLGVRLKLRTDRGVEDLPSFWDVWRSNPKLCARINAAKDPHEEKWACMRPFGYKLATNFMPGYAKALYRHFNASSVLDPCSGWGDRLLGAAVCSTVSKYVAFDPNRSLRPGYVDTLAACGYDMTELTSTSIKFSNNFELHALPFEIGALRIENDSFDLVFTSPPFFDYEMYNPLNPDYKDWLTEFYEPMFIHACRCVKPGHYVCIYIGDTSAGAITPFIRDRVKLICPLELVPSVGFMGLVSTKIRGMWVFRKQVKDAPAGTFPAYESARQQKSEEGR
jgi:hypothetical protein